MRFLISLISLFCILYYCITAVYTRKLNSTFILFWLAAGVILAGIAGMWNQLHIYVQTVFGCGICLLVILFLLIESMIIGAIFQNTSRVPEYLIVLGAQVRGTYITNSLRRRLDKAYQTWKFHPEVKIIVSGGQGKGEAVSEAAAMEDYLLQKGIPGGQIIKEAASTSTKENLIFSGRLMGDKERATAIVTNNFHIFRAVLYARQIGYTDVWGIAAGTNPVLFLNYLVRETIAVIAIYAGKIKRV